MKLGWTEYTKKQFEELKELVITQLREAPEGKLSFSGGLSLSNRDLIKEVRNDTDIGRTIIKMYIEYSKYLKKKRINLTKLQDFGVIINKLEGYKE